MNVNEYSKKFALPLLGAIVGAVAGYIYWYHWGCEEGCTIRSVWWRMSIWGSLMGGLLFSLLQDGFAKRKQKSE